MIAVDTSIVVAAFASWHVGHDASMSVLARRPRIPAHALIESFSVLTRLPTPHRAQPLVVEQFLAERFRHTPLTLPGVSVRALLVTAVSRNLSGGAIYDALIAETAKRVRATLFTRDRRAVPTYEKVGVLFELLS